MTDTVGRVLVADDSADLRDCYRLWLGDRYDVVTVADGDTALERLDDSFDVLVLDREMPGADGETVAAEVSTGPHEPAILMISGVEPDIELLDIPVDEYLQKPVERDQVLQAVERVGLVGRFRAELQDLFALASRAAALETHVDQDRLDDCEEYAQLLSRLSEKRAAADEALDSAIREETWETAFASTLDRSQSDTPSCSSVGARQ